MNDMVAISKRCGRDGGVSTCCILRPRIGSDRHLPRLPTPSSRWTVLRRVTVPMARFGKTLLQLTETVSRLQSLARRPSIPGQAEVFLDAGSAISGIESGNKPGTRR